MADDSKEVPRSFDLQIALGSLTAVHRGFLDRIGHAQFHGAHLEHFGPWNEFDAYPLCYYLQE